MHREITRRAGRVAFLTLLSRIAGLVRDIAIAHAFGTKTAADAFFVAFRIPNLLRRLFAEGALTVSFVPIFTESLKRSSEEAKKLSDASWTLMAVTLLAVSAVGIFFAPELVRLTAWGFTHHPQKFQLTVFLTQVMFPYILLVSLAALAMGVLNSLKHFAAPASSSIFMNLGIIAGALWLTRLFDPPILGLAIGVLLGGLLQLGIHLPFLAQYGYVPKICWEPKNEGVQRILRMMIPAAFGAAVYQFNVILMTLLASFLPSGSVSYLWYADRLMEFPLGVWGIAMATVLLPSLSDHAADKEMEKFKNTFRYGLRMVFFMTIPAAGGLIVLAEPIIRILFEHGTFTSESTRLTSQALLFFAMGLPFIAAVRVTSNGFYSLQDARTPVKIASLTVVVNLVFALILMGPLQHNGLALAVSLAAFFNLVAQLWQFRKKVGLLGLRQLQGSFFKIFLSTLLMMLLLWKLQGVLFGRLPNLLALALLILLGMAVFLFSQFLMRSEELKTLIER